MIDDSYIPRAADRERESRMLEQWRRSKIEFVEANVSEAAIFENLAEEAAELAQAALKLARYLRNENPVDAHHNEVSLRAQVNEELGDVFLCIQPLNGVYVIDKDCDAKLDRWVDRVAGKAHKRDGAAAQRAKINEIAKKANRYTFKNVEA